MGLVLSIGGKRLHWKEPVDIKMVVLTLNSKPAKRVLLRLKVCHNRIDVLSVNLPDSGNRFLKI
jgi:hypothetical protein